MFSVDLYPDINANGTSPHLAFVVKEIKINIKIVYNFFVFVPSIERFFIRYRVHRTILTNRR